MTLPKGKCTLFIWLEILFAKVPMSEIVPVHTSSSKVWKCTFPSPWQRSVRPDFVSNSLTGENLETWSALQMESGEVLGLRVGHWFPSCPVFSAAHPISAGACLNPDQHPLFPTWSWPLREMLESDFSISFLSSILQGWMMGPCSWESKVWGIQGQDSSSERLPVPATPGSWRMKAWLHFQDTLQSCLLIALRLTLIRPLWLIWITTLYKGKSTAAQTKTTEATLTLAFRLPLDLPLSPLPPPGWFHQPKHMLWLKGIINFRFSLLFLFTKFPPQVAIKLKSACGGGGMEHSPGVSADIEIEAGWGENGVWGLIRYLVSENWKWLSQGSWGLNRIVWAMVFVHSILVIFIYLTF